MIPHIQMRGSHNRQNGYPARKITDRKEMA